MQLCSYVFIYLIWPLFMYDLNIFKNKAAPGCDQYVVATNNLIV